ncbi:MAG: exo-alpha-sialidase [Verrucomicrobia bacterium]|nr:exo-alpha-sialidase [Verrucomicrobiota bacterium]
MLLALIWLGLVPGIRDANAAAPSFDEIYAQKATTPYYAFPTTWIAPADAQYQRRSEASAVTLKNGDVLVAWCDLVGRSDNAKGYISAVQLDAEGKPRGEPRIVVPTPPGGLNSLSPALRRLANGEIGMAFSYRMSTKEASRRFMRSADEGATWTEPVLVSDGSDPYMTGCNDRLTVLGSGRLLAPLHCSVDWERHHLHVKIAWSDDQGRGWRMSASKIELPYVRWLDEKGQPGRKIGLESGPHEPGIAERADGSLLMTMRTAMGTQFFSESFDRGETWTDPRSLELTSPLAPANLTRIPGTERLLMVWTPNYESAKGMMGRRNTIAVCVSDDGGRSWPLARRKILIHDPGKSTDYPSVLYHRDEVWITLRVSSGSGVLQGLTGTALVRVPLTWIQ